MAFHYFSLFIFISLFDIYFWEPTKYQMLGIPWWPKPDGVTTITENVGRGEGQNQTPQSSMDNCYKGDIGQTHNLGFDLAKEIKGGGRLWEEMIIM